MLICLTPQPATALTAKEQAEVLLRLGVAKYQRGDKPGAVAAFGRAYNLYPSDRMAFNIAVVLEEMGRFPDAAEYYGRVLAARDRTAPADAVARAKASYDRLRRWLASLKVSCPTDGAWLLLNGREVGQFPLGFRIYLQPGPYTIRVQKPGYFAFQQKTVLGGNDHRDLQVVLVPDPAFEAARSSTRAPKPSGERASTVPSVRQVKSPFRPEQAKRSEVPAPPLYKTWWFWTAVGSVVVGLAVGGTVLGVWLGERDVVEEKRPTYHFVMER